MKSLLSVTIQIKATERYFSCDAVSCYWVVHGGGSNFRVSGWLLGHTFVDVLLIPENPGYV